MSLWRVDHGDCRDLMAAMPEASVDAIVTDPPYGLGFMGKDWDAPGGTGDFPMRRTVAANTVNTGVTRQGGRQRSTEDFTKRQARDARAFQARAEEWADSMLRVLKPGGHLLMFGGTRMFHRVASAVEDAGFELRDCIAWMYGSGFPKSRNLDGEWEGWGTALKPAWEPIIVARKALRGTVAANVAEHGTGAINIDACRIANSEAWDGNADASATPNGFGPGDEDGWQGNWTKRSGSHDAGRWPANVVLDEEAGAILDEQTGTLTSGKLTADNQRNGGWSGAVSCYGTAERGGTAEFEANAGGASRFFYCAKAASAERNAGLEAFPVVGTTDEGYGSIQTPTLDRATPRENWTPQEVRNPHPTVKPIDLMRWLVRLVTPPDGTVLDPFTGSGTTGCAAVLEGFRFIGCEMDAQYVAVARARIGHWEPQGWQEGFDLGDAA